MAEKAEVVAGMVADVSKPDDQFPVLERYSIRNLKRYKTPIVENCLKERNVLDEKRIRDALRTVWHPKLKRVSSISA